MTPSELRLLVAAGDMYKMSLGKSSQYRAEAISKGVLVFGSEKKFYDAVVSGDEEKIKTTGQLINAEKYRSAGAPASAYSIWRRSIETFRSLPKNSLIVNWEADSDHLHWGLTEDNFVIAYEEIGEFGQATYVFNRGLIGGWRKSSVGGIPLSNLHPKARDLAVNMATLNRINTDSEYLRNLLLDLDTSYWETRSDWKTKAIEAGWHSKDRFAIKAARRLPASRPFVQETTDFFLDEIRRMATTAVQTVAYANGQSVIAVVKAKDTTFNREQLEEEIASLLDEQKNCCALTGFKFRTDVTNKHLRPSLDRKDSSLGYVAGNLQIVTRAANFFKSASDEQDWALKADAMERMAIAIQQNRKLRNSK
jgi:hypothetical protein